MFEKIQALLEKDMFLDMTFSKTEDHLLTVIVRVRGNDENLPPVTATGSPDELEEQLFEALMERKPKILKNLGIDTYALDKELEEKPEPVKKTAAPAGKKKVAEPKAAETKAPAKAPEPATDLNALLDDYYDQVVKANDENTLLKIKTKLMELQKKNKDSLRLANLIQSCSEKILDEPWNQNQQAELPLENAQDEAPPAEEDEDPLADETENTAKEEEEEEEDPWN